MRVLISQSKGKEKLVQAFKNAGAEIVNKLGSDIPLIIPTVDEELPFFCNNKEWFLLQGIRVMVNNEFAISTCRDKAEFYRFCKRHEFITPLTMQEELIIKPRFGKGTKGIIHIDRSYIVQNVIKYPEVSIDYFADWDGKCLSIIPRYRENVVDGESQSHSIVIGFNDKEIKRIGQELHLIGHNVIQGFWDKETSTFIFNEINCRFGGGSWMTFDIFNSPKWLLEDAKMSDANVSISRISDMQKM